MIEKNLVINLNKPEGMTSQQAVTKVKRLFSAKKAGHAGTLDPIATGILLICTDEATKITRFLADADKEYIAVMKLGERTDTLDSEGRIIQKVENFSVEERAAKTALERFRGLIKQTPPMYSAIKVSGKPLYRLARKGIEIERGHRTVNIYELEMTKLEMPFLEIRILCSKGTYIRSLCDDVGTALGVGAHIVSLKRTKVGDFRIEDSTGFDDPADKTYVLSKSKSVCTIDAALKHLKEIVLSQQDFRKVLNGVKIVPEAAEELTPDSYLRLKNPEGKLFAIGRTDGARITLERLLNIL